MRWRLNSIGSVNRVKLNERLTGKDDVLSRVAETQCAVEKRSLYNNWKGEVEVIQHDPGF